MSYRFVLFCACLKWQKYIFGINWTELRGITCYLMIQGHWYKRRVALPSPGLLFLKLLYLLCTMSLMDMINWASAFILFCNLNSYICSRYWSFQLKWMKILSMTTLECCWWISIFDRFGLSKDVEFWFLDNFKYVSSEFLRMKEGIRGIKVSQVVLILITLVSATVLVLAWTKTTFISYLIPTQMRIFQIDQGLSLFIISIQFKFHFKSMSRFDELVLNMIFSG